MRRGCPASVLGYIKALELGADVEETASLEIDLVAPTEWDLERIEALIAFKRKLSAEALAEAEAFARILPTLQHRRKQSAAVRHPEPEEATDHA
jgi:hypothetical protein